MVKRAKYTIFKTRWGYFGLAADDNGLFRTVLPCTTRKIAKSYLLNGLNDSQFDKNLLKPLQKQIIAYFAGKRPLRHRPALRSLPVLHSLGEGGSEAGSSVICPLGLEGLPTFTQNVLAACRKIPPGRTVSYSQLARMIGKPRAGRAVGNALTKNPVPLIIPCHRVIHSDGSLGQFSAPGGTNTKKKLLDLESVKC
jgi:O-6-methylguanine DNA methyltransferase